MRVTSTTQYLQLSNDLGASLSRFQDLQGQLSDLKRIHQLSDAPSDAVSVLRYQAQQDDWAAWQRSADDASSWASNTDSSLQSAATLMQRAKTLATSSVNGAMGADSRAALADEISSIRSQLVDIANTNVGGRALFAGLQNTAVTQVSGAWTFTGDSEAVKRQIGSASTVQVNADGAQVFGFTAGAGKDVFSVLDQLATDVRSGNTTAIATDQDDLNARYSNLTTAMGAVGALENTISTQQNLASSTVGTLKQQQSNLQDADLAETILLLNQAQVAYQAALGATAKANLPSLASYLS
jgi:flagellar hook-associated protein 3 FlgL